MMKNNSSKILITVFTPTFNRGIYLNRVFESLRIQDFDYFEWIIIDDGSNDETEIIVNRIISISKFQVKYFKQSNSGKHIAINKAVNLAEGELFLILDSDDRCKFGALSFFYNEWKKISDKSNEIAGITVLTEFENGKIVGSKFPSDKVVDFLPKFYLKNKITGDKWDIHQTIVMKKYKFPETLNEKFCPEGLVWNRISKEYKTLFINKSMKIVEYLPDGLSSNILKARINSPINTLMYYEELVKNSLSIKSYLHALTNYFRFAFHSNKVLSTYYKYPFSSLFIIILSFYLFISDKKKI